MSYDFRLTVVPGPVGTGIHLDKTDDIRSIGADEVDYLIKFSKCGAKKTRIGKWEMIAVVMAGGIAYVVDKKTHYSSLFFTSGSLVLLYLFGCKLQF
jgi:hypothetical protein